MTSIDPVGDSYYVDVDPVAGTVEGTGLPSELQRYRSW